MNKENIFLVVATFFLSLLFIFTSNMIAIGIQKEQQSRFAKELLTQAELVSKQVIDSLNDAVSLNLKTCDDESLNKLRIIVSRYEFVYDLGFINDDGKIACTANWGKLNEARSLPNHSYATSSGITLMSNLTKVLPADFKLNTAMLGKNVVFSMPSVFKKFTARDLNFSFDIKTKDKSLTFLDLVQSNNKPLDSSFFNLRFSACSQIFSYCVNTFNGSAGLLSYQPIVLIAVSLLSFILSFFFLNTYKSYRISQRSMEFRFKKAISENKLSMEYQPIVSVKTGSIDKFESLVRWSDDVYGKVSPELFLALAHKLSLYPKVAHQIVMMSVKEMAPILQRNQNLGLSLNVSTYEILSKGYLDFLYNLIRKYNINPSQIYIEVTEKIDVELSDLTKFSIKAKGLGFSVALDDFGTGVANLVWLTEVNFDVIKIDRVFTQGLVNDLKRSMVIEILSLINNLNKQVIFEGVETKEELGLIKEITPYALVQGWYFYRSLPIIEIEKLEIFS